MDPNQKKEVGLKLLLARRAMNLTQAYVASVLGIHPTHYLRIEKGLVGVSTTQLFKLCQLLKIEFNEILEVYLGVIVRNGNEFSTDPEIKKLRFIIRISEDEIKKRNKKIEKLKSEIHGLMTHGYGIAP